MLLLMLNNQTVKNNEYLFTTRVGYIKQCIKHFILSEKSDNGQIVTDKASVKNSLDLTVLTQCCVNQHNVDFHKRILDVR